MTDQETKQPIYEMKKDISIDNVLQLIDINGTNPNFQSDFIVSLKDPSKKILIGVVNQDELDAGNINFEKVENGKYARRVTLAENKHINHFIACKKDPSESSTEPIECSLVVQLKKLPLTKSIPTPPNTPSLREINDETRDDLQRQLLALSQSDRYKNIQEEEIHNSYNHPHNTHNSHSHNSHNNHSHNPHKDSSKKFYNSYIIVGVICLILFTLVLYQKFK